MYRDSTKINFEFWVEIFIFGCPKLKIMGLKKLLYVCTTVTSSSPKQLNIFCPNLQYTKYVFHVEIWAPIEKTTHSPEFAL